MPPDSDPCLGPEVKELGPQTPRLRAEGSTMRSWARPGQAWPRPTLLFLPLRFCVCSLQDLGQGRLGC